jgi:hypothetical protein
MDITNYMETRIRESEFVLLICTPVFSKKADSNKGGVGYEKAIVTGEIFQGTAPDKKFVPLLRRGEASKSLPSYLKAKASIDFRRDEDFEESFEELLRHIFKSPKYIRPPLGTPPALKPVEPVLPPATGGKPSKVSPILSGDNSGQKRKSSTIPSKKTSGAIRRQRVQGHERLSVKSEENYRHNVFINCPYDEAYKPIFNAAIFTVMGCGFRPRSILEVSGLGESRFQKIFTLISECKFGIHDISRTELDPANSLPKLNIAFELGIFMGAQRFDQGAKRERLSLILDAEANRHKKFLSDISGQDVFSHNNSPKKAMEIIRNWFRTTTPTGVIPGADKFWNDYQAFNEDLPKVSKALSVTPNKITFVDYSYILATWLNQRT